MKHSRRHLVTFFILTVLILCAVLCGTAAAEKTGKVRGGWLILRSAPSYKGKQIASYPTGTVVTITGQSGSWYAVKAPDGLTGYMLGSYLVVSGDNLVEGGDAWVTSTNGLNVRLRSGPSTQYAAIASYAPGTKCKILEKGKTFCKIKIGTLTGYMMTKFLSGSSSGGGGGGGGGKIQYNVYVTSSNGAGVNFRSSPMKGNNVIGFYEVGTKAGMIERGTTWSKISIDGKEGYMMTQFLTKTKPDPSPGPSSGSYVYSYNGKNVNLRSGPGLNYSAIDSFPPGTEVSVIKQEGDWRYVKIRGKYGYMMSQFIRTK